MTAEQEATLKAIVGHSLRTRILAEYLTQEKPLSALHMAQRFDGVTLGTASYHVRALASAGLLKPSGEKRVRGAVQKFYVPNLQPVRKVENALVSQRVALNRILGDLYRLPCLLLAIVMFAAAPSDASAYQRPARPPAPTVTPALIHGACPSAEEAGGCYDPNRNVIYLADGARSTYWHEMGHAYDAQMLTSRDRAVFTLLVGRSGERWAEVGELAFEGTEVAEYFADAYMNCRLGRIPHSARSEWLGDSGYGLSRLTNTRHRSICKMITRAAA